MCSPRLAWIDRPPEQAFRASLGGSGVSAMIGVAEARMASITGVCWRKRGRAAWRPVAVGLSLLCLLFRVETVGAAAGRPLSPRVVSYRIDARLDPEARTVTGHQVLRWRNAGRQPATELRFHLYLNAFESNRTTLMDALPEAVERWAARFPGEWGGIDITAVRVGEQDVTDQLTFVQPDDGNVNDRTVAALPLAVPVRPQSSIEVEFDFVARLPRLFMRAGHAAPFFVAAQWFPKIGVFDDGGWNCHQYHASTEFFADFGVYEVSLTVPAAYVVGHTGVVTDERDNGDGTRTVHVRAEDVHDFAWVADPRFRVMYERVGDVQVRLLLQPNHVGQAARYLGGLRAAIERYRDWFGDYPYPLLTAVDPGPGGAAGGGMEYPMLITLGTTWWMPSGLRLPEVLAVHEFGHQYWYGMVANNEFEAAWLDEGINSYVEGQIMEETYGSDASYLDVLGLRLNHLARARWIYLGAAVHDPIARPAYAMLDRDSYRSVTYAKTALVLRMLDSFLGNGRLRKALRAYFQEWRFRHPDGADWRAAVEAAAGEPLGWFFEQTLDGTGGLDYAVARLDVRPIPPPAGRHVTEPDAAASPPAPHYEIEVVVERRGEVHMPVEIVVAFDDGSEMREPWDGRERWYRLHMTSTQPAAYAVVDPEGKLALDLNRLNNSRMREPGTRGIARLAGRWGLWLQGALHAISGL